MIIYFIPPYLVRSPAKIASICVTRSQLRRNVVESVNVYRSDIFQVSRWKRFDTVLMYVSFPSTLRFFHLLTRGPLHSSLSELRMHWTVRFFRGGHASCTLHIYPNGRLARFFANGGHWERRLHLDVNRRCRIL
jgi:hypothetical protein